MGLDGGGSRVCGHDISLLGEFRDDGEPKWTGIAGLAGIQSENRLGVVFRQDHRAWSDPQPEILCILGFVRCCMERLEVKFRTFNLQVLLWSALVMEPQEVVLGQTKSAADRGFYRR